MKALFVEATDFTERVVELLPNGLYAKIQQSLMENPECGAVMIGCGGLRKLRISDPTRQKGKRGGARLIYLYVPEAKWFYMLALYRKDEKDDLTADEKKVLKSLSDRLKQEAKDVAPDRRIEVTDGLE